VYQYCGSSSGGDFEEMAKLLLDKGADMAIPNNKEDCPEDFDDMKKGLKCLGEEMDGDQGRPTYGKMIKIVEYYNGEELCEALSGDGNGSYYVNFLRENCDSKREEAGE
jgi:hypothetical protein